MRFRIRTSSAFNEGIYLAGSNGLQLLAECKAFDEVDDVATHLVDNVDGDYLLRTAGGWLQLSKRQKASCIITFGPIIMRLAASSFKPTVEMRSAAPHMPESQSRRELKPRSFRRPKYLLAGDSF